MVSANRCIYASGMSALLDRSCLTATGPDASALLQSLLSNDVDQAAPGAGVYALLLTPKARVISDVELFNTGDGYVLACPSDRAGIVEQTILRARFRRKVELAPSGHAVVWGDAPDPLATLETPAGPHRLLAAAPVATNGADSWELARVEAGLPAYGREFDEASMPAEAGLVPLAISFSKGCYPGQEPVARLQYRGHANRGLRGLQLEQLPEPGATVTQGERAVGRASSPVLSPRFGPISLAVLRHEVADGDEVDVAGIAARVRPLPFAA
jgi:folate-binding protein YgfZ